MNPRPKQNLPPICHFHSGDFSFALDIPTNRMFSLDSDEAAVIQAWLRQGSLTDLATRFPEAVNKIQALQEEGIFSRQEPEGLKFGLEWPALIDQIMHERARTVLELTQDCNLRCRYCTFGGGFSDHRVHSPKVMSEEVLAAAIDQAFSHSARLDEISIGFYGGEPLLAWTRLKAGVFRAQAQAQALQRQVRFSLTTNATLIDEEKARFLARAGFSVLVSIDGPQFLHDQYRVYPDGRGSYRDSLRGLEILLQAYPRDMHKKINLSMVLPSAKWAAYAERLWDEEPWLPRTLGAQVTSVSAPPGLAPPTLPSQMNTSSYQEHWLRQLADGSEMKSPMIGAMCNQSMAKFHQRPRFNRPRKTYFPNGCCLPGARKIYVQAEGGYQICERVHGVPPIGSVQQGIDLRAIKEIVDEYNRRSFSDCQSCFAISTCTLCYLHAFECGRFSLEKKRAACSKVKKHLESTFKTYGLVSQTYPHKLDDWDDVEIK